MRDPRIEAVLARSTPVVVEEHRWSRPLRIASHVGDMDLPGDLVTSVRVLVRVDDQVVVISDRSGTTGVLPGGRCEPGETWIETGCREVLEETGWAIDPRSFEPLGFIHLYNRGEPNPPYPHPDVLWPVFLAQGCELSAEGWVDTEGYVTSSRLVPVREVGPALAGALNWPFVQELRRRIGL
jgi:8-oxo-dGTP pyrophosphatase MutT (NUDIX family)